MNTEATGRVRVKTIPRGEAPEWVRAAWIGVVLSCYPVAGFIPEGEVGAVSGKKATWRTRQCVIIPVQGALEALAAARPDAAEWWREQGIIDENFAFGLEEVDILSGVELQKIIEVTDEMRGDPYR